MVAITWKKLAADLGLKLTPSLRSTLRTLILAKGYDAAVAEAKLALHLEDEGRQARAAMSLRLQLAGVRVVDPATTYVDAKSSLGCGTIIYPNTTISKSHIGDNCEIGPNANLAQTRVGDRCRVTSSVLEKAILEDRVNVGPFSHLRPGTYLETDVHVGNFVEIKQSRLGQGTRVGHLSYVGDAQVGASVNIGAGTITCNFDGKRKNRTVIESGVFIGSDTMLVAPIIIGRGASTGAGSVVTKDVPAGALVVGVPGRRAPRTRPPVAKGKVKKRG